MPSAATDGTGLTQKRKAERIIMSISDKSKNSQVALISKHLIDHGSITSIEAIELYGCTRLSARISDLRKKDMNIVSNPETGKNRYGHACNYVRYSLGGAE